jgi:hypothetical protein
MPNLADVNIEFGHIYVNETFNHEHEKAAQLAKERASFDRKQGKRVVTAVLIDDYNPTESFLVEKDLLKKLAAVDMEPDYLAYEAKLTPWVEELLEEMTGKPQKKYLHYVVSKGKAPCSLLVAVWHLLRLGALELKHPNLLKPVASTEIGVFAAKKIVTILPSRYEDVEKSSKEIISSTKFSEFTDRMEAVFF